MQEEIIDEENKDIKKKEKKAGKGGRWVEDDDRSMFEESETVSLDVGEKISGLLTEKFEFDGHFGKNNWGYIIKVKDDSLPKVLWGTTILNRKMLDKEPPMVICIERVKDRPTRNGLAFDWKVYRWEE